MGLSAVHAAVPPSLVLSGSRWGLSPFPSTCLPCRGHAARGQLSDACARLGSFILLGLELRLDLRLDLLPERHPGLAAIHPPHLEVARQVAILHHLVQPAQRDRALRALALARPAVCAHEVLPRCPCLAVVMGRDNYGVLLERVDNALGGSMEQLSRCGEDRSQQRAHAHAQLIIVVALPADVQVEAPQARRLFASALSLC